MTSNEYLKVALSEFINVAIHRFPHPRSEDSNVRMKLRRFKTQQALSDELLLSSNGLSVLKDLFIDLDKLDGSRVILSILPGALFQR
jgi:hypothetical protein